MEDINISEPMMEDVQLNDNSSKPKEEEVPANKEENPNIEEKQEDKEDQDNEEEDAEDAEDPQP